MTKNPLKTFENRNVTRRPRRRAERGERRGERLGASEALGHGPAGPGADPRGSGGANRFFLFYKNVFFFGVFFFCLFFFMVLGCFLVGLGFCCFFS